MADKGAEPWRNTTDELDSEIVSAQDMASGAFWPIAAIALAVLDKGVVDKNRLFAIIDSLDSLCRMERAQAFRGPDDAVLLLEQLRAFLDDLEWTEGKVVEQLQLDEALQSLQFLRRGRG